MKDKTEFKGTRVHGFSDDRIKFLGDIEYEVTVYKRRKSSNGEAMNHPLLVSFSDGTRLCFLYGVNIAGYKWSITVATKGSLLLNVTPDGYRLGSRYSDVAVFDIGLRRAWVATRWYPVEGKTPQAKHTKKNNGKLTNGDIIAIGWKFGDRMSSGCSL